MPETLYNNQSKMVDKELAMEGISIWKWFLIKGMPTGQTSMLALPLTKGDGEVITYNDQFYLVKVTTVQILVVDEYGHLTDSSVVISPTDWFALSIKERAQLIKSNLPTGSALFSFKPANIQSSYCENGVCKFVDVSKVDEYGTYKGLVTYRAPHCWGLCDTELPVEESDMKVPVPTKSIVSTSTKKVVPKKSPLNITAVASVSVAAAIGIALVIYITVVRFRRHF